MLTTDTIYTQRNTSVFLVKKKSDPLFLMSANLSELVSSVDEYTKCIYCGQVLKGGYCEKCGAPQDKNIYLGLYRFTISAYLPFAKSLIDFDVSDEIHVMLFTCGDPSRYINGDRLFRIVVTKIEARLFSDPVSCQDDYPLEYKIEAVGSVEYAQI